MRKLSEKEFEINYASEDKEDLKDFPEGFACPVAYITEDVINPKEIVTKHNTIKICFDYPLSHEVVLEFTSKTGKGFTRLEFYEAIHKGYEQIYKEEDEDMGESTGHIPGMLNRKRSHGRHGIWGHDIGDLVIEGVTEVKPAYFELSIGS